MWSRVAATVSVTALVIAVAALVVALRDDSAGEPGRRFELGNLDRYTNDAPVLFEDDEFYLVRHDDLPVGGAPYTYWQAFYTVVPHQQFGIVRGCRVIWKPDEVFDVEGAHVDGVFVDPCSGSKFNVDGERLFGPTNRGLDEFPAFQWADENTLTVDTRLLVCRPPSAAEACRRTIAP